MGAFDCFCNPIHNPYLACVSFSCSNNYFFLAVVVNIFNGQIINSCPNQVKEISVTLPFKFVGYSTKNK